MSCNGLLVALFGLIASCLHAQPISIIGCPRGWVRERQWCYKFVSEDPMIFEAADSHCWQAYGATLLSINDYAEHQFVSRWLQRNDAVVSSKWFTSGFYSDGKLVWEGDDTIATAEEDMFWVRQPHPDVIYNRVGYIANDEHSDYGWALIAASVPSNFICEIPEKDSHRIDIMAREFGYGLGSVDARLLPRGPVMIEEPIGVVVLGESGVAIYLQCDAHALPLATYRWYKGDQLITSSTNERYTMSGGRLTIQTPDKVMDPAYYSCTAENVDGKILSSIAQIMFGYLHEFPPVRPDDQWGTAYMGVRISCLTPAYNPAVKYAWFKFFTHNHVYPGHPYHFVSQSGYLYFSEVQPTDGRKYYCVVALDAPDMMRPDTSIPPSHVSLGTYLRIRNGKTDNNYGPLIHTHVFPSPPLRGSTIRLECVAYGSLPLVYRWQRENGLPFTKGTKATNRNRVLTIPDAPLEAEGNYICTVTRPKAIGRKVIVLSMETKPYFPSPIQNMLVDPGQTVVWRCKAVARPAATYSWYKNGEYLQSVEGEIEVTGNQLTIFNVQAERDPGMYQCAASNQHGTTFSTGQLKILSFPPNFDRHPMDTSRYGPTGGNVTIACRAEGAPLSEIHWLKDRFDMNLQPGIEGRVTMTLQNDLVITDVQSGDQGLYTCKATNKLGEADNSTYLEVVEGVVIDLPPTPLSVLVNRTSFLPCSASYNPNALDVAYRWEFNGHPVVFKNHPHLIMGNRQGISGLYIREAQYTHNGVFTCVAQTPLHAARESAMITVNGPPGSPAGVFIDTASVTTSSARVTWTVGIGTDHGSPIIGYDIEADTNYEPGTWTLLVHDIDELVAKDEAIAQGHREDQRTVTLEDLIPNTGYRFRVRAINSIGRGVEASRPSARVKIPSTSPVIPPHNVGGGNGKVGTLHITWTPLPPSEQCGSGIGYNVYWKKYGEKRMDWKQVRLEGNHGEHTALVGVDNYYLQYEVKVEAFNDIGPGPNSTIEIVYSAMGIPVAVPTITDISNINQTASIVYFDPVPNDREHVKGRVRGYTIEYYQNANGCNPMSGCKIDNHKQRNVWGQTDHVMIIDLEINSEYFFRAQVLNTAGRGPKGEWRRSETANIPPMAYPRFVVVSSHGPHSVKVSWQGIQTKTTVNEEIVVGYKVKYWEVQSDIRNANETISDELETNVILYSLQSKTVYQVRVMSLSAGGDGTMSSAVFFTILGGQVTIDPATTEICYEWGSCDGTSFLHPTHLLVVLLSVIVRVLA